MNYNFTIAPVDTDSISFCKPDMAQFSEEERKKLLDELNNISPEKMVWEDDGYYNTIIVIRAKNYVLWDGNKVKIKGSGLVASNKEPALREFIKEMIQTIIDEQYDYLNIYNKYVKEIVNLKDIKRWANKKTITTSVLNPERTNEQRVLDALDGKEFQEGDKVYVFFKDDGSLSTVDDFDGSYDSIRLLEKLYKTALVFETIIPKETFINYKLKKNQKLLDEFKES